MKRLCAGKGLGLNFLSRYSQGRAAVVSFVVVGSSIGMPARRVFRHAWRDSTSHFARRAAINRAIRSSTTIRRFHAYREVQYLRGKNTSRWMIYGDRFHRRATVGYTISILKWDVNENLGTYSPVVS
ncbi:hypothetical protein CC86DRAFT_139773 [Ophiobolus disseminans]|uniref:Uncharacterized protein n=1 Tax=Ophiobolus disseminans TaxID=1469910 RepID=A0A6A7AF24_9PLEO|nr:hypothetical protein CC86DRAFT_139773 [Ophiobolus disseminans]